MIEIIPGPNGRQIIVRHSEDAGWSLEWRDTDEHRIYSTMEFVQCLAETMSQEDRDEADKYRALLMRLVDE